MSHFSSSPAVTWMNSSFTPVSSSLWFDSLWQFLSCYLEHRTHTSLDSHQCSLWTSASLRTQKRSRLNHGQNCSVSSNVRGPGPGPCNAWLHYQEPISAPSLVTAGSSVWIDQWWITWQFDQTLLALHWNAVYFNTKVCRLMAIILHI